MSTKFKKYTRKQPYFNPTAKIDRTSGMKDRNDTFITKIIAEFKDRQRAEIQKWRRALSAATDPENPVLYPLQDLYDNLSSDGHYISQTEMRKAATLCSNFSINDPSGKEQAGKTAFFKQQWFYDFMEDALDSIIRGYTLLELVNPLKPKFQLIPRRNIVPLKHKILLSVSDSKGVDYVSFIEDTLIEIGNPDDLGLLSNLCGQLIWKRNAQQSWAEFSERFGMPMITATTNKSSDAEIAKIRAMLATLGEAAQAVLPEGTTIDIKPAAGSDSYNVYDKQIDRINTEISKAICGGTMVSDDGSSRSQSEVHERNLDDKIAARDKRIITFITNDQLIPMLARFGHDLNPEKDIFTFDQTYELTLKEQWDIVNQASYRYDIPADWVSKTFGFPIIGEKEVQPGLFNMTAQYKEPSPGIGSGGFYENFR